MARAKGAFSSVNNWTPIRSGSTCAATFAVAPAQSSASLGGVLYAFPKGTPVNELAGHPMDKVELQSELDLSAPGSRQSGLTADC
jgi:hypothetical protein